MHERDLGEAPRDAIIVHNDDRVVRRPWGIASTILAGRLNSLPFTRQILRPLDRSVALDRVANTVPADRSVPEGLAPADGRNGYRRVEIQLRGSGCGKGGGRTVAADDIAEAEEPPWPWVALPSL